MDTSNLDIVYCLKNGNDGFDELRYSLRSLENFPHRNIWIYGGCPKWVQNIRHVPQTQSLNKWQNSTNMLEEACRNNEITKNFVWFNDDFFIMKPVKQLKYWYDRTLLERIADFRTPTQDTSKYGKMLGTVAAALVTNDRPLRNYALHIPIIFNRKKFLAMCQKYPRTIHGRSLYCNEYKVSGIQHGDVKIYDKTTSIPRNSTFVSTTNISFSSGQVGREIRAKFPDPCRYEKISAENFVASPRFKSR